MKPRHSLHFEIAEDTLRNHAFAMIVDMIPRNWSFVSGSLCIPTEQINLGADARIVLHDDRLNIEKYANGPALLEYNPDYEALLLRHHDPKELVFNQAGYGKPAMFWHARRFIQAFLAKGYQGYLRFSSECKYNDSSCYAAGCRLHIGRGRLAPLGLEVPSYVSIEWLDEYGGKRADVEGIIELCKEMKLATLDKKIKLD